MGLTGQRSFVLIAIIAATTALAGIGTKAQSDAGDPDGSGLFDFDPRFTGTIAIRRRNRYLNSGSSGGHWSLQLS